MSTAAGVPAMRSPVLLIIFRRPELVEQAIARLRAVRPARLYVAADGPRPGVEGEAAACEASRRAVIDGVDWPCDLRLRFREHNLGVQHGVVDAIDWLFGDEEQGIILEDDIAAEPDFFRFCDELLERYRDDQRVATISGTSYTRRPGAFSYRASAFIDMWGWATWRDRWQHYDAAMRAWPDFADSGRLAAIPGAGTRFVRTWRRIFDDTVAGRMKAWDYQWILTCWNRDTISLHPAVPLVRNIGWGPAATNTPLSRAPRYVLPPRPLRFPLRHPAQLTPDPEIERAMWRLRFYISAWDGFVLALKKPLERLRDRLFRIAR
jgi:hypothetical protein